MRPWGSGAVVNGAVVNGAVVNGAVVNDTAVNLAGVTVGVTGASGFCGTAVAAAAAEAGATVVALGRRSGPVGVHRAWDASASVPDLQGVDVVLHLAAAVGDPGRHRGAEFARVNVDGARRVLDAAAGRRVVWVSSASVYDSRVDRSSVGEEHPTSGGHLNEYARTKAVGDAMALAAGAVVLRPHAVYGAGDPHLLPRLRRALRGRQLLLPGPDVPVSLTAVENLASACLAALAWQPRAYNVADAEPYRRDAALAAALEVETGRSVRVRHVPESAARLVATRYAVDQVSHPFVLDTSRARATGWVPTRSLDHYLAVIST